MLTLASWPAEASAHPWERVAFDRDPALRIPEGYLCWRTSPPAPDAPVLALFDAPGGARVQRTTRAMLSRESRHDRPVAWQRQVTGKVLSPGWRLFPDAVPRAGAICCAMFFDLARELDDSAGFGRFERGDGIGCFVDRVAYPGEHDPSDPRRWAVYAWREARDFERSHALLAASLGAGATRAD